MQWRRYGLCDIAVAGSIVFPSKEGTAALAPTTAGGRGESAPAPRPVGPAPPVVTGVQARVRPPWYHGLTRRIAHAQCDRARPRVRPGSASPDTRTMQSHLLGRRGVQNKRQGA